MPRIYIPTPSTKENQISITGEKARYLTTVLRCKKGEELIVFDGEGNCLRTNILRADRKEVIAGVLEQFTCDIESPLNIILVQGLLKGQKMDMIIQKATELGVKEIIPVITERSQPRETRKIARCRKIAEEASRQSGRSMIPVVYEPKEFNQFLAQLDQLRRNGEMEKGRHREMNGFIFWEEGGISLKEAVPKMSLLQIRRVTDSPIHLVIGPEGGFTKEEIAIAKEKGFIITTLGRRILRAETAAISAITLIQFLLGDMG
jgi:16S rRNA (uracil1498-N3)-methyltransferase